MAKQYWVGEFFVDLSRNQISQHTQAQTLPPKALQVLTYLAENRGRVISYDELLNSVWANAVVTPNTLQRSIAQLRKALGENSKAQGIIKTHAKQGYSLECDVTWNDENTPVVNLVSDNVQRPLEDPKVGDDIEIGRESADQEPAQPMDSDEPVASRNSKPYWLTALVTVLVLALLLPQFQPNGAKLQFSNLHYLTATDDKEYGATYSPDGQFILFHRYFKKLCLNNIWAKNAATQREIQLTNQLGTYGDHSLSADGKKLVFIKEEDCTKPITQNTCYTLMSLDFEQALLAPQSPTELLNCQNTSIKRPVWVDEDHIVMMQRDEHQWRLIKFSVTDKSSANLYEVEDGYILHFTYSSTHDLLAVSSLKGDGLHYIDMLNPQGELLSSHPIQFLPDEPRPLKLGPTFIPNTDELIFASSGQLYTLSAQGKVSKVDFPFSERVGAPYFRPDGDRLLLIKGRYDSDVALLPVPSEPSNGSDTLASDAGLTILQRSIEGEDYAKFQPSGQTVAMVSERTGDAQVWLIEDSGATVLSQFPKGNSIFNLHWDRAGKSLLVLANQKLHQLSPDAAPKPIAFTYPVLDLFHWDSQAQRAIANIFVNGQFRFVEIDLPSQQYTVINNRRVSWADKPSDGPLIFMDHQDRLWRRGAVEDKLIEPLVGQGSSKRFVVDENTIYGINKSDQLWSYDLQTKGFKILAKVTSDIDYLTDIKDKQLLVTLVVAEKKEVIELSVEH